MNNKKAGKTAYPKAGFSNELRRGEVKKPCCHCGNEIGIKRWYSWTGLLVRCPHCKKLHGEVWGIKSVLLISLLLNACSFFLTMYPKTAIKFFSGFVVLIIGFNNLSNFELPMLLELGLFSVLIMGPMIINAVMLLRQRHFLSGQASVFEDVLDLIP